MDLREKKIQQVAKFMADMQFFHTDQIVWLDETGSDRRDQIRKYEYSLRGEHPVYHRQLHRGNRISANTAMSTDCIIALKLFQGTLNSDRYLDFRRGTLIREMQPFNGLSPQSVLVLDNCSVHHVSGAIDLL